MLGRIYTVIFILTILVSLWYQRIYLNRSAIEFNAQVMAENAVLPTITGKNYHSFSFEDGVFKTSFSGDNMVYFSNKQFEATNNLVYNEVNSSQTSSSSNLNTSDFNIKTDKATGEFLSSDANGSQMLMGKSKLKYANLPNIVNFSVGNNVGQTSHVYFEAIKRTLESESSIESHGPSGNIKGVGFFYDIDEGEFVLKSNVEGMVMPAQVPKN
ncbi:MAG: hypothetical protein V4591_01375 [Bdellovibrionota bacterium]